jgi:hypothetical protein
MIPNADGGGQNNRHTTLPHDMCPTIPTVPKRQCRMRREDTTRQATLLWSYREHNLILYVPLLSIKYGEEGGSFFFGFRNIISVHGGRNSAGANTEGGLFFLLTEGATYCTFTKIPHLYRTFRLSADSSRRCDFVFDFCVQGPHEKIATLACTLLNRLHIIDLETDDGARESASCKRRVLHHECCKFTRSGVKVVVNVVELPWLRLTIAHLPMHICTHPPARSML